MNHRPPLVRRDPSRAESPRAHRSRRRLLLALTAGGLQACTGTPTVVEPLRAEPAGTPPPVPPAPAMPDLSRYSLSRPVGETIADTGSPHYRFERFNRHSADGKRHYRVQLAIPNAGPPVAGYPLLVMLDGNAALGALTAEQLEGLAQSGRPPVIVALGYETPLGVDVEARAFDYTPKVPGEDPTWDDKARGRLGGGADLFLDHYDGVVRPELLRRAPVDASRSTLWGHSYGGLLALYTLFMRPGLFARYAAADPSLWWHEGAILTLEQRAVPLPAGTTRLLLMAGSAGQDVQAETRALRPGLDPAVVLAARERRRAVPPDAAEKLAERLGRRAGLQVDWRSFPGVTHGPMRPTSIPPTLEFASR